MKQEVVLIGKVDDAQIAQWKMATKMGVYAIIVEEHIAYFREPTRHDVNAALAMASDDKPLEGIEHFGKLCFLGGSEEVLNNDKLFLSARFQLKHKLMSNDVPALLVNL